MIYGQDEPMLFPVADLYDSGMMQMYINAAREQYNQNREDMKEFIKTYGDFMSPFSKDIDWVDQQTRGRVNAAMQYMQENGIDPLRSAEGRAIIQNVINSTDRAGINTRKANATLGEQYLKARGALIAAGKYSDDYEKYLLQQMGLPDFEHFDSSMGTWTRTSPAEFKDLNAATSSWFDAMEASDLGLDPTGKYRMSGINREMLSGALTQQLPGFASSDLGRYYLNKAKNKVLSENPGMSDEQANAAAMQELRDNIITANHEKTKITYTVDPYAKSDHEFGQQVKLKQIEHQNAVALENLRHQHAMEQKGDGDSNSSSSSKNSKGRTESSYTYSLLDAGIRNFSGSSDPGKRGLDIARSIGNQAGNIMDWNEKRRFMAKHYMMVGAESPETFKHRFEDRFSNDDKGDLSVPIWWSHDRQRLKTYEEVMSNTYGYIGKIHRHPAKSKEELDGKRMYSTGNVWTSPTRNNNYEQYVEVRMSDGSLMYYKVFETEKSPGSSPAGFSTEGSQGESIRAAVVDNNLNKYVGMGNSEVKNSAPTQIDIWSQTK